MGSEKPKKKHKKGLWSPEEDQMLRDYVLKNGHACWTSIPIHAGLQRNGKSCRLRWINYLRPGLKRGAFSVAEVETILTLHQVLGNKWSQIAHHLPGRSDNEIKNYWHSCLKKRVVKMAETTRIGEIRGQLLQHIKGSVLDRDEQVGAQGLSLPKVLFAEWLSFDQFYDHGFESNAPNHSSNHQDTAVDGMLQHRGGTFGVETNPECSQVYADDMLRSHHQLDYFPGELCMNYDELN